MHRLRIVSVDFNQLPNTFLSVSSIIKGCLTVEKPVNFACHQLIKGFYMSDKKTPQPKPPVKPPVNPNKNTFQDSDDKLRSKK